VSRGGTSEFRTADGASGYIYFNIELVVNTVLVTIRLRTQELVGSDKVTFTLTDDTIVVDADNPSNTGSLQAIITQRKTTGE
jgi:very-short-patch-repair endonuclease